MEQMWKRLQQILLMNIHFKCVSKGPFIRAFANLQGEVKCQNVYLS